MLPRFLIGIAGTLVLQAGLIVLLGYYLQKKALISWSFDAVPMSPTTAIVFIVVGAGFIILSLARRLWKDI